MSKKTVYFASLGCSKNLVDSEVMLGILDQRGYEIVQDEMRASVIVVNTCSFINDAKKESVDVILELIEYKNREEGRCEAFVVTGCLPQRYSDELLKEIPEIDLVVGTGEYQRIGELLDDLDNNRLKSKVAVGVSEYIHDADTPRVNSGPSYSSWLKVSEGCNRNCTFCAIPKIRGKLRSRDVKSLLKEATMMAEDGVKELNLIAQDLSDYGKDLSDENNLPSLLKGLEIVDGVEWIRLLYFYPDELTDEIIQLIKHSKKICKYIDMPVQHFSDSVLKRMNRKITGKEILEKIASLRKEIPEMIIRTSLIVGFPGESDADFDQLLDGIKSARFNNLGVFKYSKEEDTPAFKMEGHLLDSVIEERHQRAYELQQQIAEEISNKMIGKRVDVLVEGLHEETDLLVVGRSQGQAPDIDGRIIINDLADTTVSNGDIVSVEISESVEYDLVGAIVSSR